MTNSQRLATVRARLIHWVADEQVDAESTTDSGNPIVRESILIRGEYYCGRRFYTADHHAVWFIEEDELKIYRSSGELVCVMSAEEITNEAAAAEEPKFATAEESDLPTVLKMPTPAESSSESNAEDSDEADGQIRRAA